MGKGMVAAAIIIVIAIIFVAAYALTNRSATAPTGSTSTVQQSNNTSVGLSNTGGGILSEGCAGPSEFNCSNASISDGGELSLTFASNINATLYDIHVACIAYNSSTDRPANASSWYSLSNLGTAEPYNFTGTSVGPLGTKDIESLQCYAASGLPESLNSGQTYEGLVLLEYTNSSTIVNSSTYWTTAGAAAIKLQAP